MSLNRFAFALLRLGVKCDATVLSVGVWQVLQPTTLNRTRPVLMEVAPPGVVVDGVGCARSRMNIAKPTVSAMVVPVLPTPSKCVMSSGVGLNARHAAGRP